LGTAGNGTAGVIVIVYTPTGPALNEATTATDTLGATEAGAAVLAETVVSSDTLSGAFTPSTTLAETIPATDTLTAMAVVPPIAEAVSATDTLTVGTIHATASLNEIAPAADAISYAITGGTVIVDLFETARATDALSSSLTEPPPAIHETASATDGLRFTLLKFGVVQFTAITAKVGLPRGYIQIPQTGT
jgi:hypothetical protein